MSLDWQRRTPTRLLAAILISNAAMAASFGALSLRSWHLAEGESLPMTWKIVTLIPATLGIIGAIVFQRFLKKGVASGVWSEEAIATARILAEKPWWTAALWAYLLFTFVNFAFSTHQDLNLPIIMVGSALSEARSILRRVPLRKPGRSYSIYPAQPLVSDHWGLPPNHLAE